MDEKTNGEGTGQLNRKRGGQPGNTNATRHGFYARKYTPDDLEDLESMMAYGLDEEIAMLRVVIRKVLELAYRTTTLQEGVVALGALGTAAVRLAGLLRVKHLINGGRDPVEEQDMRRVLENLKKKKMEAEQKEQGRVF